MSTPQSTSFECPSCAAKYEVVRVEAQHGPIADREITCVSCGGPLDGREGPFVLKYFLVARPKRGAGKSKSAPDLVNERAKQIQREALLAKMG
jgi:predicted RNA-binding Zn-ribbon protein involved in translation (DUF1610 family)